MTSKSITIDDELWNRIVNLSKERRLSDDENFLVVDYVGSNVDDAFALGHLNGLRSLAQEIMESIEQFDKSKS